MNDDKTPQSWKLIKTEPGPDLTIFSARFDWVKNPRNGVTLTATVLEAPDWVNVVALTPEGKLVMVRQYRFGTGEITLEIPAGIIDEGEDSQQAAARELLEETGFSSSAWEYLGWIHPNPAFLNNRCHHWLARDVAQTALPSQEPGENLTVEVLSHQEIREGFKDGFFRQALAVSALSPVFDLRGLLA